VIRLRKRALAPNIARRLEERAARYFHLLDAGEPIPDSVASSYRDAELKAALRAETSDKCAYCESKVPHVDYGDIEHIRPKSVEPRLRFAYDNMTYACGVCNTKKGEYHDPALPLVNPYDDDPQEHFIAAGPMVMRSPDSDRGLVTERRLDLNRSNLIERRQERLESIATLVDRLARTRSQTIRDVLLAQVQEECRDEREYAFIVRAYVNSVSTRSANI